MSETAMKEVKKEEPDDEIQIVHMNLRVPIVIPPEVAVYGSMAPIRQPLQEQPATTAAAAARISRLPPGAQPSREDKNYWTGKDESDFCPRCAKDISAVTKTRVAHYKRCHYNIYYVLVRIVWMAPLDRWMAVYLGPPSGRRECVHCLSVCGLSRSYRGRGELAMHIEKDHPESFHEQMRNHDSGSTATAAGAAQVDGVTTSPTCQTGDSAASPPIIAAATAATAATAAATPISLTLHDSPLPADEAYLRGRAAQGTGRESCPRCNYDAANSNDGRRHHYIRHHYNVYYMKVKRGIIWTLLDRWMAVHFGDVVQGARVCVLCAGDARYYSDYRSRAELIRHMTQVHPLAMIDLAREYSAPWNNFPIAEKEVHGLLMNALSTFD